MYNFFIEGNQIKDDTVEITGNNYKHIAKVLRMAPNDKISICNKENSDRFIVSILSIDKEKVIGKIIEKCKSNEMDIKVTIYQGIPKSDKMEYIIQKAVELGAYNIVPVEMKNCVVKIKDEDKKINRWQTISEAAAKQSKRNIIPKIARVQSIKKVCEDINNYDLCLIAYENEKNISIKDIFSKNKKIENIAIVIGPEGGINQEEVNELTKKGAVCVTLGSRILRTETASLAILSMIMYEFEL